MMKDIHTYFTKPHNAVLTLHRNPDMDSIGSNLGLMHVLESLGSTVTIFSQDPVPETFMFIPGAEKIRIQQAADIPWHDFDIFWALDQADTHRMGETSIPEDMTIINIDHHGTNPNFGAVNIVEPDAASTASILLRLFQEQNIEVTSVIAQCLMTGLAGDTIFFQYVSSSKTFIDAATLIQQGADYDEISFQVLGHVKRKEIQFLSEALHRMKFHDEKKCVSVSIPISMWQSYGEPENGKELLQNYLQQMEGTDFGFMLIESSVKNIRVSLRARHGLRDVSKIAKKLGGGGHAYASGARLEMSVEEAEKKILDLV